MKKGSLTTEQQKEAIEAYQSNLAKEIDAGRLYNRRPKAHKWKVTYRTIVLRELASWRFCDLIKQALILEEHDAYLGARILIRSAIETLALIIFSCEKWNALFEQGMVFMHIAIKAKGYSWEPKIT